MRPVSLLIVCIILLLGSSLAHEEKIAAANEKHAEHHARIENEFKQRKADVLQRKAHLHGAGGHGEGKDAHAWSWFASQGNLTRKHMHRLHDDGSGLPHHVQDLKPSELNHADGVDMPGFYHICQFSLVAIASFQIGKAFRTIQLPVISGFLLCGMLAGPDMLSLLEHDSIRSLRIIDQLTLTAIAFTAGSELNWIRLKPHLWRIAVMITCIVTTTFFIIFFAVMTFSSMIPFEKGMDNNAQLAVALLVSTVLIARSPASAIAVVKETGAQGSFTTVCVGVGIALDVLLIVMFSLNMELAEALIDGKTFDVLTLLSPFVKILFSSFVGCCTGMAIDAAMGTAAGRGQFKYILLTSGMIPFVLNSILEQKLHAEPLLTCVVAGIFITNYGTNVNVFHTITSEALPVVNLFFFTSAGAELGLANMLEPAVLLVGFMLFLIRLLALFIGGYCGSYIAGRPPAERYMAWMGYITQAGVGMGLAKDVAITFPAWGSGFASLMISVMFLNQLIGPICFRKTLILLNEVPAVHKTREDSRVTLKI